MADHGQEARRVLDELSSSVWAFATLTAALEAGLLELLAEPQELGAISAQVGLDRSLAEGMLEVLVALGLVHRDDDQVVVAVPGLARCWLRTPRRFYWPSCAAPTCRAAS